MKEKNQKIRAIFMRMVATCLQTLSINGCDIRVKFSSDLSSLQFSIPVYQGEGVIPEPVFNAVMTDVKFDRNVLDYKFIIDEINHQVIFRHGILLEDLTYGKFEYLLKEVAWLANQWKKILVDKIHEDYTFVYIA